MTAKIYFERVRQAEKRLRMIAKQREHWEEMATRMSGTSEVKIRSTDMHSPTEDVATRLVDLGRELDAEEAKYLEIVREAKRIIDRIPQDKFREILTLRYICGHSWKIIQDEMDYTGEKTVYRVHGWALQEAAKMIPNDT